LTAARSNRNEAHLPAQQDRAQAPPWIPRADGHKGRSQGALPPPHSRPQEALGLTDSQENRLTLGRLRVRADFLRAARGIRRTSRALTLETCPTPDTAAGPNLARIGFTASRKIGGAVERNRAKRRLRAAAAAVLPLYGLAGNDYVLVARRDTLTRDFSALLEDLASALRAAHKKSGRMSSDQAGPGETS
jgi:ribonuclease P protein component